MITLHSQAAGTSVWSPLQRGRLEDLPEGCRVRISDGAGRTYLDADPRRGRVSFTVRGSLGIHRASAVRADGSVATTISFRVAARTALACDRGVYARYAERLWGGLRTSDESRPIVVGGRLRQLCVCWLRDHTYTLKALRHFIADVTSGTGLFLEQQQPDGMIWDDIHPNRTGAPSWFGEALGDRYHGYLDGHRWLVRRIPVEADVEYIAVEAVHHGWKASGDDAWMAARLPALERAIAYTMRSPLRWSRRHRLVKRAYTMDSWDFKHPDPRIGGGGDHRCLAPGRRQPFFLFHGDNSGLYAAHRRLAEMYAALGRSREAASHRARAKALRERANRLLWNAPIYAHMVPERPIAGLKERVGDDRRRISLSLPYTINRGLPDHRMAVRIIDEYRRRARAQRRSSFAEWWAMDPMYLGDQWGDGIAAHQSVGEYMNGGISPLVAGELARAAFEHGREDYGADILRRLWDLSEADGGAIHDTYRRLPPGFREPGPAQRQLPVDLRAAANVGLRHRSIPGVAAWTGEGDNDLRGLPTGRQRWHSVDLAVIDPATNRGRSVVALGGGHPATATIQVGRAFGALYAVHALGGGGAGTIARYVLVYADGGEHRIPLVAGREIANWWNPQPLGDAHAPPNIGRVCWRGANPTVRDVGVYLCGLANPHPDRRVAAVRLEAEPGVRLMVVALSTGDGPPRLPRGIRSFGLPSVWSQGAVHHALVEGLAGIEDTGRAFDRARISPRWSSTEAAAAEVCVHYPASDGYCAYRWRHDARRRGVVVDATGSFASAELRVLMPAGRRPRSAHLGRSTLELRTEMVERSAYAVIALAGPPDAPITIRY